MRRSGRRRRSAVPQGLQPRDGRRLHGRHMPPAACGRYEVRLLPVRSFEITSHWFLMLVLWTLGGVSLATCYKPNVKDGGLACASDKECPDGLKCASDNHCWI